MLSHLSLLLAVTTLAQDSVAPPAAPARKHRRTPVVTIAPMTIAASELQAASVALTMAQPQLQALAMVGPIITDALRIDGLDNLDALDGLDALDALDGLDAFDAFDAFDALDEVEGPNWKRTDAQAQGDVADSLYRAARQALNNSQYSRAAEQFSSIRDKYPRSAHVPNTYYWQAFALYRDGSDDALRAAREALKAQKDKYPKASTRRDAEALLRRVQGALAQRGDSEAATEVVEEADEIAPRPPREPNTPRPPREPRPPRSGRAANCDDDDDDIRIAALNAVLQMDADRAVPLLKTVLARRDEGSACLRRKAVFLVSQKRSDETSRILLDAVRNDPDKEVREQAVFWLSQVPGEETVAALDSLLQDPNTDPEIQEKAIFSLSQHRSPRAAAILCTYSGRRDRPAELREKSIFWLGQRRSAENQQCLRDLYKSLDTDDLKEKVIFSLSQMGGADNYRWLMDIALNARENIELRKKALFWAGQGRNVDIADLVRLYESMNDREMKEQLIFVYSQRREEAAVEKLCQIGKVDPDRELRKKALFWIGQSRSARAMQCLQEVIGQ